jgi:hypothetical protein
MNTAPRVIKSLDDEGDNMLSIEVGPLTVFATEQYLSGDWVLSFALTTELDGPWMDTLTGAGAFRTIQSIRPAIEALVADITALGKDWWVCCDSRRARLYARYIPIEKITIIY